MQKLLPFDPELEQTLKRRREKNLQWVPSLQGTFLQPSISGNLHSKGKMAFVIPEAGLPLCDSLTAHTTNILSCITYPAVEEGSAFEIKQHMLNILPTFHGLSSDDPNMHIAEFLMGCKNILVAIQQPLQATCSICSLTNHDFWSCPHKDAYPEFIAEQVNSFNNFPRPRYDPYSNFYNPGWRDHPNLKWDKDQHSRPQFQQQVQQPAAPKAAWEVAIEKLANTTTQEIQNLQAAMKNMEKQMGQIVVEVSERAPGTFPSQTVPNPRRREECNAIQTLRSGKSYNNRHANSVGNSQAAELPQTKFAIFAYSDISADSGQSQDRSENTAEATTKTVERFYEPPMPYLESSALIDLGASVNLMPYSVFKRLGEGELKPTSRIIQLVDLSITYPRGVIEDVIVKVDNLYIPADFMVLDMDEDLTTPIILGRPFLATAQTLIDVEAGTLTFRVEDQTVVFKLFEASIHSGDKQECMRVDVLNGLPHANFATRSSTSKLPIKTQNVICHQVANVENKARPMLESCTQQQIYRYINHIYIMLEI
ncbi:unnamed protein product [Malus baccata var. baccata]